MKNLGQLCATASRAELTAVLFALDPIGFAGVVLRAQPDNARDDWLGRLRELMEPAVDWRRIPVGISLDRLLGGLDYSRTLQAGRPVYSRGALAECDNGIVQLAMAERLDPERAAIIAAVIDQAVVVVERDGQGERQECRLGIVAIDEGLEDDECLDPALADRLAFRLDSSDLRAPDWVATNWPREMLQHARSAMMSVTVSDNIVRSLAATSAALGIGSVRGDLFALRACRALAALNGRCEVIADDAMRAAELVLAHRARHLPAPDSATESQQPEPPPEEGDGGDDTAASNNKIEDVVLEAAQAAIPAQLLAAAQDFRQARGTTSGRGRAGQLKFRRRTGRVVGAVPAERMPDGRLNFLATLKAALPWQTLRRDAADSSGRIRFRKDDLQVSRHKDRNEATTIFVVDASGSQAAQRLGEVKGAIELLIADCYVRRDQVALIAFRGKDAEILLAPTRALARARRTLAELPGGGGTPLSLGIDRARELVEVVRRQGRTPRVVFLTDGRANICRDGSEGHEQATAEAQLAARLFRTTGLRPIVVDTARRPRPKAREFAEALAAAYVPLPQASAESINTIVGQFAAA